ncbi:hypothetical protein [Hymenobacter volaticus]|uniref:Uncharacterized protein n=1 Tax=Hymenobacter volaticus TaxID=2932254 RepID=A0ABY4GCA8_9BACT|nr:hypothetical protein [Hymenobacter volaticus]UOQ68565.1 hypothetical protein MUN86_23975 [Hymenobacter volaticus]
MSSSYYHFQTLAYSQQDRYVQQHGQLIAHRWHENFSVELYDLGSFYCERWLEQECLHRPRYQALANVDSLEIYSLQERASLY